jgi:hypothetical protein
MENQGSRLSPRLPIFTPLAIKKLPPAGSRRRWRDMPRFWQDPRMEIFSTEALLIYHGIWQADIKHNDQT